MGVWSAVWWGEKTETRHCYSEASLHVVARRLTRSSSQQTYPLPTVLLKFITFWTTRRNGGNYDPVFSI